MQTAAAKKNVVKQTTTKAAHDSDHHRVHPRRDLGRLVMAVAASWFVTSKADWYLMRGSGIVSLLLFTAVVVLGIATVKRWRPGRLPRFVTPSLHRSISLLAVLFLGVHIATAVIDPYAMVGIAAVFVPFVAGKSAFWVGLGALSLDLIAVLIVSSLLRRHHRRAGLARAALGRVPVLAGRGGAHPRHGHRRLDRLAALADGRLRGPRGSRGRAAAAVSHRRQAPRASTRSRDRRRPARSSEAPIARRAA